MRLRRRERLKSLLRLRLVEQRLKPKRKRKEPSDLQRRLKRKLPKKKLLKKLLTELKELHSSRRCQVK